MSEPVFAGLPLVALCSFAAQRSVERDDEAGKSIYWGAQSRPSLRNRDNRSVLWPRGKCFPVGTSQLLAVFAKCDSTGVDGPKVYFLRIHATERSSPCIASSRSREDAAQTTGSPRANGLSQPPAVMSLPLLITFRVRIPSLARHETHPNF